MDCVNSRPNDFCSFLCFPSASSASSVLLSLKFFLSREDFLIRSSSAPSASSAVKRVWLRLCRAVVEHRNLIHVHCVNSRPNDFCSFFAFPPSPLCPLCPLWLNMVSCCPGKIHKRQLREWALVAGVSRHGPWRARNCRSPRPSARPWPGWRIVNGSCSISGPGTKDWM